MEAKEFGTFLKSLRKQRKLTIRQLDLYSGVSHSYLSQLENGRRGIPSPDILKKLSNPLDVSYQELMTKAGYLSGNEHAHGIILEKFRETLATHEHAEKTQSTKKIFEALKDMVKQIEKGKRPFGLTAELVQIPILGTIKAGYDLYAEQQIVGYETVAKEDVADGEYFFLIVTGDSMIDEGIKEGFRVLVRRQNHVDEGKIGVVLVNRDEATLKRVYYQDDRVVLQASNRTIPPRILPVDEVRIQGQVTKVEFDV
jgi:repressor LexA